MRLSKYLLTVYCFVCYAFYVHAQFNTYEYKRQLLDTTTSSSYTNQHRWRTFSLPDSLFGSLKKPFSDIRIIAVTETGDTTEVPYLVKATNADHTSTITADCSIINTTSTQQGKYFTIVMENKALVNTLSLDFNESDFDWHVTLEGSYNQQQWFTILNNYRILSLTNTSASVQFTDLHFPSAQFSYYRVFIPTNNPVTLTAARVSQTKTINGVYKEYSTTHQTVTNNNATKQTIILVPLTTPVPISKLILPITSTFAFYRSIHIEACTDSTKTQTGWHYQYVTLYNGTLYNEFSGAALDAQYVFSNTITKQLRITIDNNDNQPLSVSTAKLFGNPYQVICRLPEHAQYYMLYGNTNAMAPVYDITHFTDSIPNSLPELLLAAEQKQSGVQQAEQTPLFANAWWLWGVIIIVVCTLGYFTLTMIKKAS